MRMLLKRFVSLFGIAFFLHLFGIAVAQASDCKDLFVSAPGEISWVPSEHVQKQILNRADLAYLLKADRDAVVHVEFSLGRVRNGISDKYADRQLEEWWTRWLDQNYPGENQSPSQYASSVSALNAKHGPEMLVFLFNQLEIVPPESGSIIFGVFGIRGRWESVAKVLDQIPEIQMVSPSWRPPTRTYGL